ncbi:CBS domain-containing protein [Halegenticoccus soli]|uniref:CBS domain-containing protein n=1 Tax=Halegenticoccus soli TaxID=1985678 RepID=UPI000C6D9C85|nr:CBS domain-containing protein [Halegenticoccus soli]
MTDTDVFVGRLMSSPVRTVSPDTPVQRAAETMLEHGIGSVVVAGAQDRLEGILTATDFVRIAAEGRSRSDETVAAYMSTDVVTTTANAPITDVADAMIEHGFHHVPVVDETEGVIGMITTTDLTSYLSHAEAPSSS